MPGLSPPGAPPGSSSGSGSPPSESEPRIAVVTGASSGIGAAVAAELAGRGARVVGLARRFAAALPPLPAEPPLPAGMPVIPPSGAIAEVGLDVTDAAAVSAFFAAAGDLDVLVIAAGSACFGGATELEPDALRELLDVHVVGAHNCVRAALPALRRRHGHIVLVGSVAARIDVPNCIGYSAAKYAQLGYARAIAAAERDHGVRVTTALIGATDTPLWNAAPTFDRAAMLSPQSVARTIATLLDQPHLVIDELVITPTGGILNPSV